MSLDENSLNGRSQYLLMGITSFGGNKFRLLEKFDAGYFVRATRNAELSLPDPSARMEYAWRTCEY